MIIMCKEGYITSADIHWKLKSDSELIDLGKNLKRIIPSQKKDFPQKVKKGGGINHDSGIKHKLKDRRTP